jgi:hypothetical protein
MVLISPVNLPNSLTLAQSNFGAYLTLLNQVKAAYAALGQEAEVVKNKVTGATSAMEGPLDHPGDPMPSNMGRTRSGGSGSGGIFPSIAGSPGSNYFQVNSPKYGMVTAFKVGDPGLGNTVIQTTTFIYTPSGRIEPLYG